MQEPMLIKWGPLENKKPKFFYYFYFKDLICFSHTIGAERISFIHHMFFLQFQGFAAPPCSSLSQWWSGGYRRITTKRKRDGEGANSAVHDSDSQTLEGRDPRRCVSVVNRAKLPVQIKPLLPRCTCFYKTPHVFPAKTQQVCLFSSFDSPSTTTPPYRHFNISSARRRLLLLPLVRNSLAVPVDFEEFFCTRAFDYCTFPFVVG